MKTTTKRGFGTAMALSILLALAGCTSSHSPGVTGGGDDADEDGYGEEVDCDDHDPTVHPDAEENCEISCESWGDGIDNNCDGRIDEPEACWMATCNPFFDDYDGDGYDSSSDCNDSDPNIHPGADEQCYEGCDFTGDGVDNNCDGRVDEIEACGISSCNPFFDYDGDGYGEGFGPGPDCDDTNPDIHPDAPETPCDGVDSNCDGEDNPLDSMIRCDVDLDGDGYAEGIDCDDTDPAVSPAAEEVCDNGADDDCDLAIDEGCTGSG